MEVRGAESRATHSPGTQSAKSRGESVESVTKSRGESVESVRGNGAKVLTKVLSEESLRSERTESPGRVQPRAESPSKDLKGLNDEDWKGF
eukprot:Nk52_evm1s1495 gene=Nk52_evmTU1s1495